jgi:hypothetical protein
MMAIMLQWLMMAITLLMLITSTKIMQTLDLDNAAEFLKMNAEVLRRQAKAGAIPGRKTGKNWIFVKEHLADWVSGRYPEHGQSLQVIDTQQTEAIQQCQSTNVVKLTGYNSPTQTAKEYNALLGLPTNSKRKNSMTG